MVKIDDILLVVKKLRKESKSIWRLLESREFLSKEVVEDRVLDIFIVKISRIDIL